MEKQELEKMIQSVKSRADLAKLLGYKSNNGQVHKKINDLIKKYDLDISHFDINGSWKRITHEIIKKICPICQSPFETKSYKNSKYKNKKEGNITCSVSCANKYFRSFMNEDFKRKPISYRTICFQWWEKECALCKWKYSLDVHHIDRNRKNNEKQNLIPLCQNHHSLTLFKKNNPLREEVDREVEKIIEKKIWEKKTILA